MMETSSPKVRSLGGASPEIPLSDIELADTIGKGTLALFVSFSHLAEGWIGKTLKGTYRKKTVRRISFRPIQLS